MCILFSSLTHRSPARVDQMYAVDPTDPVENHGMTPRCPLHPPATHLPATLLHHHVVPPPMMTKKKKKTKIHGKHTPHGKMSTPLWSLAHVRPTVLRRDRTVGLDNPSCRLNPLRGGRHGRSDGCRLNGVDLMLTIEQLSMLIG